MTIVTLEKPINQLWSGDEYNFLTEGKGMTSIALLTNLGTDVTLQSNEIAIRLFPGAKLVLNGVLAIGGVIALDAILFTLPFSLHEDSTFQVAKVNGSETLVGFTTLFAEKSGTVRAAEALSSGEFLKISGSSFWPNVKPSSGA